MVLGVPFAKVAPLLFKAVTNPFVNSLKRNVPKSPFWKHKVFIPLAQAYNRTTIKLRLWSQGLSRSKDQIERSARLSNEAAVELGAEIVVQSVAVVIGLASIILQQTIAARSEEAKEQKARSDSLKLESDVLELRQKVMDIGLTLQELDARMRQVDRTIVALKNYDAVSAQVYVENET